MNVIWDVTLCSLAGIYQNCTEHPTAFIFLEGRFVRNVSPYNQVIRNHIPEDSNLYPTMIYKIFLLLHNYIKGCEYVDRTENS